MQYPITMQNVLFSSQKQLLKGLLRMWANHTEVPGLTKGMSSLSLRWGMEVRKNLQEVTS